MTATEAPVTGPATPSSHESRRPTAFHFRHGAHTLPWTPRHHSGQLDLNPPVGTYHSFARPGGRFIPFADTESVISQVAIRQWRADRWKGRVRSPFGTRSGGRRDPGRAGAGAA